MGLYLDASEHAVTVESKGLHRWVCSCGERGRLMTLPGHAEQAGRQHAERRNAR